MEGHIGGSPTNLVCSFAHCLLAVQIHYHTNLVSKMVLVSPTKISRKIHGLLALLQRLCETRMSLEKERENMRKHSWTGQSPVILSAGWNEGWREAAAMWRAKGQQGENCHVDFMLYSRQMVHLCYQDLASNYVLRVWQSGDETRHAPRPISQPNSNGKLTTY